jgi:DNA-directed RNA polymerase specialized sigma24 family protein
MKVHWLRKKQSARGEYAGKEEFVSVFECERAGLQRLAVLLTANSDAVKCCLVRAFRECISSSSVSKRWTLSWTRRVVIRNAISLVMSRGSESSVSGSDDKDDGFIAFSPDDTPCAIAGSESILDLPEFDRLVFVICDLEHYSIYDCALLLGRSLRDIVEARQRVDEQLGKIGELNGSPQHFAVH